MIRRILITGLAMALWTGVLLPVIFVNSLPGTETDRETWNATPVIWWLLVACGPLILIVGSIWAAKSNRKR